MIGLTRIVQTVSKTTKRERRAFPSPQRGIEKGAGKGVTGGRGVLQEGATPGGGAIAEKGVFPKGDLFYNATVKIALIIISSLTSFDFFSGVVRLGTNLVLQGKGVVLPEAKGVLQEEEGVQRGGGEASAGEGV